MLRWHPTLSAENIRSAKRVRAVRRFLAMAFLLAGWTKLTVDFNTDSRLRWFAPGGWDVFRTFQSFGHYWHFIALTQITVALLLLTRRYATLGAMALFPITINVFMISVFTDFPWYTPVITSVCLLLNMYLLWQNYLKWRTIFES